MTRLDPATGANAGTFPAGPRPAFMASDTAVIGVLNISIDSVTRLSLVDGASLGTFFVGDGPSGAAFDGARIWVANSRSDSASTY